MDVATLAELLHETAEHHDQYENTQAAHNWWRDWYAVYIDARVHGSTLGQASDAAGRYMEEVLHVAPRQRRRPHGPSRTLRPRIDGSQRFAITVEETEYRADSEPRPTTPMQRSPLRVMPDPGV
jgi:hypothetical protein